MRIVTVLSLGMVILASRGFAQWPVVLEAPGLQLIDPNVALGANGEALVAAAVHLPDDNVHVFSVTLDGQIEWSGHYDEPWNQTPTDVVDDGEGGCLVFVREVFIFHDRFRGRLKLYRFDSQGDFVYSVVVGDSMNPQNGYGSLAPLLVINGMVCMAWYEQFDNDSASYRIQRALVETGEPLEGPHGRFLHPSDGGVAATVFQDSIWAVVIAGTLYFINPMDGNVQDSIVGDYLGTKGLIAFEDSLLAYGVRPGGVIAFECYGAETLRWDSSFTAGFSLPYNITLGQSRDGFIVAYSWEEGAYCKKYSLVSGFSQEILLSGLPDYASDITVIEGRDSTRLVWVDWTTVFLQSLTGNTVRWPNGYAIGTLHHPANDLFGACSGNDYGWVCWEAEDGNLVLQPADTLDSTDVVEPPASFPNSFHLFPPYPNPFNSTTTILFSLSVQAEIRLSAYNTEGQFVEEILFGDFSPGVHEAHWSGPAASGVYFLRLESPTQHQIQKVIFLK